METKVIPRGYQLEILERAKVKNTIAFLETGSGKTFISVMLIQAKSDELRKGGGRNISAFVVPRVPLVIQQAEVLRVHSDLNVGQFFGAMGVDNWSRDEWAERLANLQVMVCTAQILLDCLRHSVLTLEDVNLLVLDECHHAHKRNPYALIMEEFYWQMDPPKRPAVFGMTASPVIEKGVKSRENCAKQFRTLEKVLDATIMTAEDFTELELCAPTPSQRVISYQPPNPAPLSALRKHLLEWAMSAKDSAVIARDGEGQHHIAPFGLPENASQATEAESTEESKKGLKVLQGEWGKLAARKLLALVYALDDLGRWCAYQATKRLLADVNEEEQSEQALAEEARQLALLSDDSQPWGQGRDVRKAGRELQRWFLKKAKGLLRCSLGEVESGDLSLAIEAGLVTPKVEVLVGLLKGYRHQGGRLIVFVERVIIAHALTDLLASLSSTKAMVPTALTGHCTTSLWGSSVMVGTESTQLARRATMSSKQQQDIIARFRSGEIQVVVATDVAEEGLDIQQCHAVIRFDLPKTVRGHIQSRGRARRADSDFILMVLEGGSEQKELLSSMGESEGLMKQEAAEPMEVDIPLEQNSHEEYCVPETGAKVTINSAIPTLYHFCQTLPKNSFCASKPLIFYDEDPPWVVSRLVLPSNSPVKAVEGPKRRSKAEAKQAACLEACRQLHAAGGLTHRLVPDVGAASEEEDSDGISGGEHLQGPVRAVTNAKVIAQGDSVIEALRGGWINPPLATPVQFRRFEILFAGDNFANDPLQELARDFVLLTTLDAPLHPGVVPLDVDLYLSTVAVKARVELGGTLELSGKELGVAKRFHVWLMRWLLEKLPPGDEAEGHWEETRAFLLLPRGKQTRVDWALMEAVLGSLESPPSRLGAKVNTDGQQGDQLLTVEGWVDKAELRGALVEAEHSQRWFYVSHVLENLTAESKFSSEEYTSYVHYFQQRHDRKLRHPQQPLLCCRPVSKPSNLLTWREHKDEPRAYVELPPELCRVWHGVPGLGSLHLGALRLPSVMRRSEGYMLAAQLRDELGAQVLPLQRVLEAITPPSAGEEYSYERLELLGDSFLKYAVTRHLYLAHPTKHEGQLSPLRERHICNENLCRLMLARGLHSYIVPPGGGKWNLGWLPAGVRGEVLSEEGESEAGWSKKTVADVAEALIGAHVLEGGPETALGFLVYLGVLPESAPPGNSPAGQPAPLPGGVPWGELEGVLGYRFADQRLLAEAVTHPSCVSASVAGADTAVPCYQRLEFLGDAVLDLCVAQWMFKEHQKAPPGVLTDLKGASVNNEFFARVSMRLGLQRFLRHESEALAAAIEQFRRSIEKEEGTGGGGDPDIDEVPAPKVLGDVLEALAGAVLVDSGFDQPTVWKVFAPLLAPLPTPENVDVHPVGQLYNRFQGADTAVDFQARQLDADLVQVDVLLNGVLVGSAKAAQKKAAKRLAAAKALKALQSSAYGGLLPTPEVVKDVNGCLPVSANDLAPKTAVVEHPLAATESSESSATDGAGNGTVNHPVISTEELGKALVSPATTSGISDVKMRESSALDDEVLSPSCSGGGAVGGDESGAQGTGEGSSSHTLLPRGACTGGSSCEPVHRSREWTFMGEVLGGGSWGGLNTLTPLKRSVSRSGVASQVPRGWVKSSVRDVLGRMLGGTAGVEEFNRAWLYELCAKRGWLEPVFREVGREGPPHAPVFVFGVSVVVPGSKQPMAATGKPRPTSKAAKDSAALAISALLPL